MISSLISHLLSPVLPSPLLSRLLARVVFFVSRDLLAISKGERPVSVVGIGVGWGLSCVFVFVFVFVLLVCFETSKDIPIRSKVFPCSIC